MCKLHGVGKRIIKLMRWDAGLDKISCRYEFSYGAYDAGCSNRFW